MREDEVDGSSHLHDERRMKRGEEKGEERRVMSCASIILQRDVRTHVNRAEQTRREKNRTEQTRREQNRIDYNRTEQNRIEQNRIE